MAQFPLAANVLQSVPNYVVVHFGAYVPKQALSVDQADLMHPAKLQKLSDQFELAARAHVHESAVDYDLVHTYKFECHQTHRYKA
jgi:hypothetical protein